MTKITLFGNLGRHVLPDEKKATGEPMPAYVPKMLARPH